MTTRAFDFEQDTLLFGHTDEETAILIDDYPYGRRVRTQIRYWLETTKHGDRFVSQTLNPKTGRWNKPKKSTYLDVAVMYREAESGHIGWIGLGTWPDKDFIARFCAAVGVELLSEAQREKLAAVIGRTRAMEHVTFEVKSVGFETDEEREEHRAEQEEANRQVNKLIAIKTYQAGRALAGEEA